MQPEHQQGWAKGSAGALLPPAPHRGRCRSPSPPASRRELSHPPSITPCPPPGARGSVARPRCCSCAAAKQQPGGNGG